MKRQALGGLIISLMVLSSMTSIFAIVSSTAATGPLTTSSSGQTTSSFLGGSGSTYGIGLSGAPVYMDVSTLQQLAGKPYSIATMELNITRYFVPMGVHLVFLDPGWGSDAANTSSTFVAGGFHQSIADWLSLGVKYQISTIFFFKQFGYFFSSPSWDVGFLNAFPNARTVNGSGVNVPLANGCAGCLGASGWTIADTQDLYTQIQDDLLQLNKWYGGYTSWIGFGEGATGDNNQYADTGAAIRASRPWDNGTIYAFANSIFFKKNINPTTGYYLSSPSVLSKVWAEFLSEAPLYSYSVGYGLNSDLPRSIFAGHSEVVMFQVPVGTFYKGFTFKSWLQEAGTPSGSLTETLLANYTGGNRYTALETQAVTASIGSSGSWVSQTFASTLVPSMHYEIEFTSSTASPNTYAQSGQALWVQSLSGANITINPYFVEDNSNWHAGPGNPVYFEVPNSMTVNQVTFQDSDRAYDPNSIGLGLVDAESGTKLASGTITFAQHGDPIQLSKVVTLEPGVKYELNFSGLPAGDYYGTVQDFIASDVSPSYVGQTEIPTFTLGYGEFGQTQVASSNHDFFSETDLQASPGYLGTSKVALRFMAPGTGTLSEFEVEVIKADNTPGASFTASLYSNDPSTHRPGSPLAQGSISLSDINSTFKAGNCTYGRCTWANVTFTGASLTGGAYYWIVMSSPESETQLERLVNPVNFWVLWNSNGDGKTWGVPLDGPTELAFQIKTSAGDINNTAIGQYQYQFASSIAQSFEPLSSFQLIGLQVPTLGNGGSKVNFTAYIESDSGSDAPSGTILATFYGYPGFGQSFGWGLNHPLNLTANMKYWIVLTAKCMKGFTCSSPPRVKIDIYRSDASSSLVNSVSFGGLHYVVWSGSKWVNQPFGLGNIGFYLVGSNVIMKTYSTRTLYNEIKTYDDQNTGTSGWNSFLQYDETTLMYNLTVAMAGLLGRQFYWYSGVTTVWGNVEPNNGYVLRADAAGANPLGCEVSNPSCGGVTGYYRSVSFNYLKSLGNSANKTNSLLWSSLGQSQDNGGTLSPSDMLQQYLVTFPPDGHQTLTFADWIDSVSYDGILNITENSYSRSFGQILNRMVYNGGWFGTTANGLSVLWVTNPSNDGDLPMYLEPAVNVVTTSDGNLTGINLGDYNVVVNSTDLTASAYSRVESFVNGGGGYVTTQMGADANIINPIIGLRSSAASASPTSTFTITPGPITKPYASVSFTPYWLRFKLQPLAGSIVVTWVEDSNGNPIITSNRYGQGIGVLVEQPSGISPNQARLSSLLPGDSYVTLLINAVFFAAHESSMLPIFWDSNFGSGPKSSSGLNYFSIDGSPGSPLFWASDYSSQKEGIDVHLNATFYGVTAPWVAIDMQNMSVVASGTTSDIHLKVTLQPWSWMPLYIRSISSDLGPVYSTAKVVSASISGDTSTFSLSSAYNQSNWLIVDSPSAVTSVSNNLTGILPTQSSLASLNKTVIGESCNSVSTGVTNRGKCLSFSLASQEGWFYDSTDELLYIHFRGGTHVEISVNSVGASSVDTTSETTSYYSISNATANTTYSNSTLVNTFNTTSGPGGSPETNSTSPSNNTGPPKCSSGCAGQAPSASVSIQSNTGSPIGVYVDNVEYSTPSTFVWPLGSDHTMSIASKFINTPTERSAFLGWTGSINSSASSQTFVVRRDMKLNLSFKNLCLVTIGFTDAEGRLLDPGSVQLGTGSQFINLTSDSIWLYSGNYQVKHAVWKGADVATSGSTTVAFAVDKPGELHVLLPIFDEVVMVRDVYGLPIQGAKVTLTGRNAFGEAFTNSSGIALFPQLPPGPVQGTIQYLTFTENFNSPADSSHIIYATAMLSYPILITILGIAAVGFYATLRSIRKKPKPGEFNYFFG